MNKSGWLEQPQLLQNLIRNSACRLRALALSSKVSDFHQEHEKDTCPCPSISLPSCRYARQRLGSSVQLSCLLQRPWYMGLNCQSQIQQPWDSLRHSASLSCLQQYLSGCLHYHSRPKPV